MLSCLSTQPQNATKLLDNTRSRRKSLSAADNLGPSIVDEGLSTIHGIDLARHNKGEKVFKLVQQEDRCVIFYRQLLSLHLTRRADLAFIQLVMAHNTDVVFASVPYPDQVKGVNAVSVSHGHDRLTIDFQAAHSATFPRLVFSLPGEPTTSKCDKEGSAIHNSLSAIIDLPREANDVDSDIDFRKRPALRPDAIADLNDVATGELSPYKAHARFLNQLQTVLMAEACVKKGEGRGFVADHHLHTLEQYRAKLSVARYDRLLGLSLSRISDARELRGQLYPIRIAIIRRRNELQGFLHQSFLDCEQTIVGSWSRRPTGFSHALRATVLAKLKPWQQERLEEMYGQSLAYYQAKGLSTARALVATHKTEVKDLTRTARQYCQDYEDEEFKYRRLALKCIRTFFGQSQQTVGNAVDLDRRRVSEIENDRRGLVVTDQMVTQLARHFGIFPVNLAIDLRLPTARAS